MNNLAEKVNECPLIQGSLCLRRHKKCPLMVSYKHLLILDLLGEASCSGILSS